MGILSSDLVPCLDAVRGPAEPPSERSRTNLRPDLSRSSDPGLVGTFLRVSSVAIATAVALGVLRRRPVMLFPASLALLRPASTAQSRSRHAAMKIKRPDRLPAIRPLTCNYLVAGQDLNLRPLGYEPRRHGSTLCGTRRLASTGALRNSMPTRWRPPTTAASGIEHVEGSQRRSHPRTSSCSTHILLQGTRVQPAVERYPRWPRESVKSLLGVVFAGASTTWMSAPDTRPLWRGWESGAWSVG
jgi:hypothetical protein